MRMRPSTLPHNARMQTCEYIEEEEAHLKEDLLAHPLGIYNEATATAGAWCLVVTVVLVLA